MHGTLWKKCNRRIVPSLLLFALALTTVPTLARGEDAGNRAGKAHLAPGSPPPPRVVRPLDKGERAPMRVSPRNQERLKLAQKAGAARRLEVRGDYEVALTLYQQLFQEHPERREFFDGVRRCLIGLGRFDEAADLIRQRIASDKVHRDPAYLYAALGSVLYQAGHKDAADKAWNDALVSEPGNSNAYLAVSSAMLRLRLVDRAIDLLHKGRHDLGDSTLFAMNLASILQSRMDWQGAAAEYLNVLRGNGRASDYVSRGLANFPNEESANESVKNAVEGELEKVRRHEPWPGYRTALREILADQLKKNGDYAGAFEVVRKIDKDDPHPGERLLHFAGEAMEEDYDGVARQALNLAAKRLGDPEGKAVVNLALAEIAERQGHGREADSLLTAVLAKPASRRIEQAARYRRGVVRLVDLGDAPAAGADFSLLLRQGWPEGEEHLRYLYAWALAEQDSLDTALGQLYAHPDMQRPPEDAPVTAFAPGGAFDASDARLLAARITLWQGKREQAGQMLDTLLIHPTGADAENDALVLLHLLTTTSDSDKVDRYGQADRAEFRGRDSLAIACFDSLAADTASALGREAAWRSAILRFDDGDPDAMRAFAEGAGDSPRGEEAWMMLGAWWERQGNSAKAKQCFETLLVDYPDGLLASQARLGLDRLAGEEGGPALPPTVTP